MKARVTILALTALLLPQLVSGSTLTLRELAENCREYVTDPTSQTRMEMQRMHSPRR